MIRITPGTARPLHGIAATRAVEQSRAAGLPPHTLMQRAGLAVARLALAVAPHARTVWIACGPGNNGGDGMEAAIHLKRWGKNVLVTWLGTAGATGATGGTDGSDGLGKSGTAPPDAARSHQGALDAGVRFADAPPVQFDLCIDALLGIGSVRGSGGPSATRPPAGRMAERMAEWIALMNSACALVLAVDVPSGLNADTGHAGSQCVKAQFTLSLLTLKPGLFTGQGRDACGQIWLDELADLAEPDDPDALASLNGADGPYECYGPDGLAAPPPSTALTSPNAWLGGAAARSLRAHASHKGSYGDVAVIGGAPGMTGAALLAASAALHSGAGRVFVALLDGGAMEVDLERPELMFRHVDALDFDATTLVCGCGGGDAVRHSLTRVLAGAGPVVLDADALNVLAGDSLLAAPFVALLQARAARNAPTVLTPHPLEAARLAGSTAVQVQQNRLATARLLSDRFMCTIVLKGSGTVIATPGKPLVVNPTGNAALATAGTGDVLAGLIGAGLANAQRSGTMVSQTSAHRVSCEAVFQHGAAADNWPTHRVLTAGALAGALAMR